MKLEKDEISKMARIYKQLDENKDGFLSPKELKNGFKSVNNSFVLQYGKILDWKAVIATIDSN